MTFFGLKWGQDLENLAVHPHLEFQGVPPPPGTVRQASEQSILQQTRYLIRTQNSLHRACSPSQPVFTWCHQTSKCKGAFKVVILLACVASVSVWFRSKEIPRKGAFGFDRARNETRAIFLAVFDSRSSFFSPKPHRNACYAGYHFAIQTVYV